MAPNEASFFMSHVKIIDLDDAVSGFFSIIPTIGDVTLIIG